MASLSKFLLLVLLLAAFSGFVSSLEVRSSTTASSSSASSYSPPSPTSGTTSPPPYSFYQENFRPPVSHFPSIIPILADLGFHDLAMAAHSISVAAAAFAASTAWNGPITIFAPADSSVRTCHSCSIPLLLQEHTVPGLYPHDYLRKLIFGTKVETILPGRCLTVTSAVNESKIFIGGSEITRPELFNNGHIIIHGLQGFMSHLSPYSCSIDKVTSLSLPHPSPAYAVMRLMLTDAMIRLRTSGYSVLALAIRVKYPELVTLHNMTVFALDDAAIFHGGHAYVRDIRFHIVPNMHLMLHDLERLPAGTTLPSLEAGETLTVTTAAGGGILAPMRLNYVRIRTPDLIHNPKIVVHGLVLPFPHFHIQSTVTATGASTGSSGFDSPIDTDTGSETFGGFGTSGMAPSPVFESTVEIDDHHGL
ncbi:hypothetical protein V2J09_002113 [Rumex salicifolius]